MTVLLEALIPLIVIGAAFIPVGETSAADAIRVAAPLLAGLGLAPVSFASSRLRGAAQFLVVVAASCGGVAIALWSTGHSASRSTATGWVALTFLAAVGVVAPFLAIGARATAASAWLLICGAGCGSLAFVRPDGGAISPVFLELNPLVRIFQHGLGLDWLHAANVYPHVGTLYYRYPERSDGIPIVMIAAGAGMLAAVLLTIFRHFREGES